MVISARIVDTEHAATELHIPEGYKQTELGVIPEDWDVTPIGKHLEFKNGLNKAKEFFGTGTPIINYMDVFQHSGMSAANINGKVTVTFDEQHNYSAVVGDVFFTRTSETVDEIGISSVLLEEVKDAVFSGFILRGRSTSDRISNGYKKFVFRNGIVRKQITSTSSYTTRALTNGKLLSNVLLPLPPTLAEQEAIAEALSDADALISSLETLLVKKRNTKLGAVQELFFPKEWWVEKEIQEIAVVGRGRVISHREINRAVSNSFPVYSSQTSNNGVMGYLDTFDFEGEYVTWTTDGANAGTVFYREGRFNCTNVCGTIKLYEYDPLFIAYALARIAPKHVSRNLGNPKLMNDVMKKVSFKIPSTKEEQVAIATIIFDMDAEIIALEEKLAKSRLLKQGMMQELLTGKTRLIDIGIGATQ